MMMAPDRFANALYATPPLDAVETRILEMLAAAENDFVPLSVLHDASGLSHNAWGLLWKKFYDACACSLCRTKKKDKIFHILDGLRLAESDDFSLKKCPLKILNSRRHKNRYRTNRQDRTNFFSRAKQSFTGDSRGPHTLRETT